MNKVALVTGITGQDGSYLAELLLEKGYQVHGTVRRASTINTSRIDHIYDNPNLKLHYADLADGSSLVRLLAAINPDEIYNLAAQAHVRVSFDCAEYTSDITGIGALRLFESVRTLGLRTRIYQASSSEMFGKVAHTPQTEDTPFYPRSPYGCAKAFAHYTAVNYRESYDMHVSCGILFNHESPRRGETFVTRKITKAAAAIKAGKQDKLFLGNLNAKRDWGYAKEYVEAMWLMLQQDTPDDYVIATGVTRTVQEFLEHSFEWLGLDWRNHVEHDPRLERPAEVDLLLGNPDKAERVLGWKPQTSFDSLAQLMVESDWRNVTR